jgi:uncharacterized protein involved in tolerance to divalent cations
MWYALTATSLKRDKKEARKEYYANSNEVVVAAESRELLEQKLKACLRLYPQQTLKYLRAGIKIVEADSMKSAKQKAKHITAYFNDTGQYSIL